jgi:hypothetical protein
MLRSYQSLLIQKQSKKRNPFLLLLLKKSIDGGGHKADDVLYSKCQMNLDAINNQTKQIAVLLLDSTRAEKQTIPFVLFHIVPAAAVVKKKKVQITVQQFAISV